MIFFCFLVGETGSGLITLLRTGVGNLLLKEDTVDDELDRECTVFTGDWKDLASWLNLSVSSRGFFDLIGTDETDVEETVTEVALEDLKYWVIFVVDFFSFLSFSSFFSFAI